MRMRAEQRRIAELIEQLESSLAELYATCATYFAIDYQLWRKLSLEEEDHAKYAKIFFQATIGGHLVFQDSKVRKFMLESALQHIGEVRAAVVGGSMNGEGALRMAMELEDSMVEKGLFTNYTSENPLVQETLHKLSSETEVHARMIRSAIDRRAGLRA